MRDIIIKVNNNCILRCPYCFAYEEDQNELLEDDMKRMLRFCRDNQLESVKITGGEPFLYKYIVEFINHITEFADVMIFSNLMVNNCLFNLKRKDKVKILANINEPDFYTDNQYKTLMSNISYAVETEVTIVPGRTFYHKPFDLSDIIALCEKYGLKTIRISQANPTILKNNMWLTAADINCFLHYIQGVNEELEHKNICINFDCPIAPCVVDNDLYSYFCSRNVLTSKCGTKLVVNPDLTVEHCYITAPIAVGKSIFQYNSYDDALNDISSQLSAYRTKMALDKCHDCEHKCDLTPCGCYGFMDLLAGGRTSE